MSNIMSTESKPLPGTSGYKIVQYFPNWAIYGRKFEIFHMDWSKITHINYAFADVGPDGSVKLTDPWADTDKRYTDRGDSWNDPPGFLYGCFGQAFKLKQKYRHVKVTLIIGLFDYMNT